jgi:DNA-binding MarR family transcriptional regulator
MASRELSDSDYSRLLEFRTGLRRFLSWSEQQAAAVGLTPAQHQLLLAIRGSDEPDGPTVGDIAEALLLRHHSAVELIDRAAHLGVVKRRVDSEDHRVVRVVLTNDGDERLARLSAMHVEELRRLEPNLQALWKGLDR